MSCTKSRLGQGVYEAEVGYGRHSAGEARQAASGARVHREDDRTLRLDPGDSPEKGAERVLRVDLLGRCRVRRL